MVLKPENIAPQPQLMLYPLKCIHCGLCISRCPQGAISTRDGALSFQAERCTNCGTCTKVCASQARVLKGAWMTAQEARQEIDRDLPFYQNSGGGVTFSGGEPLLHPAFIIEIAQEYRQMGLNSAVETCGCVSWDAFEAVLPWIDLFLFDLKCIDSAKHQQYCGRGNEQILSNLSRLCQCARVIVRMPIIPGINDTDEDSVWPAPIYPNGKSTLKQCIACRITTWGFPNTKLCTWIINCPMWRCPKAKP